MCPLWVLAYKAKSSAVSTQNSETLRQDTRRSTYSEGAENSRKITRFSEMAKLQVAFWLLVVFTVMLTVNAGPLLDRMFGKLTIPTELKFYIYTHLITWRFFLELSLVNWPMKSFMHSSSDHSDLNFKVGKISCCTVKMIFGKKAGDHYSFWSRPLSMCMC